MCRWRCRSNIKDWIKMNIVLTSHLFVFNSCPPVFSNLFSLLFLSLWFICCCFFLDFQNKMSPFKSQSSNIFSQSNKNQSGNLVFPLQELLGRRGKSRAGQRKMVRKRRRRRRLSLFTMTRRRWCCPGFTPSTWRTPKRQLPLSWDRYGQSRSPATFILL